MNPSDPNIVRLQINLSDDHYLMTTIAQMILNIYDNLVPKFGGYFYTNSYI